MGNSICVVCVLVFYFSRRSVDVDNWHGTEMLVDPSSIGMYDVIVTKQGGGEGWRGEEGEHVQAR